MTTKYIVKTFEDIVDAVIEELGEDSSDIKIVNRIKRDINSVYLQEVVPYKNWWWLTKSVEVQAKAYFNTGTATVTSNSTAVVLTESPGVTYKGFYFSPDGYNEVYKIAQHTSGSPNLVLESPYTGQSGSLKTFRIWSDVVPLPADCMATLEVRHSFRNKPLESWGRQEFRRLSSTGPKASARPENYSTGNLADPDPFDSISGMPASTFRSSAGLTRTLVFATSLGATEDTALLSPGDRIEVSGGGHYSYNGEWVVSELATTSVTNDTIKFTGEERKNESSTADTGFTLKKAASKDNKAKYRELLIYPALFDANTTLYVDYKVEPSPLTNDSDEPMIPLEDRNVLVYGALSRQWVKHRDEETANRNAMLFGSKIANMAGRIEDSVDLPKIQISPTYLRGKRRGGARSGVGNSSSLGFSAGGGASGTTGTPNRAAIFNNEGRLVSSPTISVTQLEAAAQAGVDVAAHIADTEGAHAASAISVAPVGNLSADDVQEALVELQADVDTRALDSDLDAIETRLDTAESDIDDLETADTALDGRLDTAESDIDQLESDVATAQSSADAAQISADDAQDDIDAHIADSSGAHVASAISNTPSGNLSSTDVQGALNELQGDIDGLSGGASAAYDLTNLGLACSVSSNALTVALKQSNGSTDPASGSGAVKIGFRSSTATSGAYNQRSVTSSLSLTVSSGSTLGTTSGNEHILYVYALDNAGTVELAISQTQFDDLSIQSTTAEGGAGASDSNATLYSTTARSNVPIRLIARLKSTQTTAGTWASAPTEVSLAPGQLSPNSKVIVIAKTASAQSFADATATTVAYGTVEKDTHGAWNTSTYTFTAPRADDYFVTPHALFASAAWTAGNYINMNIAKNGTTPFRYIGWHFVYGNATNFRPINGSTVVPLNAGDTIVIRVEQSSGGSKSLHNDNVWNHVTIVSRGGV